MYLEIREYHPKNKQLAKTLYFRIRKSERRPGVKYPVKTILKNLGRIRFHIPAQGSTPLPDLRDQAIAWRKLAFHLNEVAHEACIGTAGTAISSIPEETRIQVLHQYGAVISKLQAEIGKPSNAELDRILGRADRNLWEKVFGRGWLE